jgi:serine/threonine protein kinase
MKAEAELFGRDSSAKPMVMPSMIRKIEPGDVIGRCRIIRELGRGGVGTVYLASHQTLQIEVALKILSPALSLDHPALAERFIREAQIAARIRHPNVIAVMDAAHDEATGLYFIVQEYVGGGSLAWHLRNGPMPERKALGIITGIANAVAVAEENGIVHRDIKPDNILLDGRGTAKLADLGLAKHGLDTQASLTLGGSFMGTPAYMSPEQARDAKAADTRDDIYSLGATFYECLTGQPPFQGETPYNIMSELLTKPSPCPRQHRPEISRSSDLVCRKMMAKTRQLRYPDAKSLIQDLNHCQIVGDSGLDGLDAASFEQDSNTARQQALDLGVQPSGNSAKNRLAPPAKKFDSAADAARRSDTSAFRAAALLILLVSAATMLLAWLGSHGKRSSLHESFARLTSAFNTPATGTNSPPAAPEHASKPIVHHESAATPENMAENSPTNPAMPPATDTNLATIPVAPIAPPESAVTNLPIVPGTVPAMPADTNAPGAPIPAVQALPDSALQARNVAENSLPRDLLGPDGHAPLLRIRGRRDPGQLTPTTWTFEFFDPHAAGHAQIVSVRDHRVVDHGERVTDIISPYTKANILPADIIDSIQALDIAQQQIPGVQVSSSEFALSQEKNSAPFWTVTLWARNAQAEEVELGDLVMLAEKGDVISNHLQPERLKD